jgi:glycerol uptake facilitator-like aquaporin
MDIAHTALASLHIGGHYNPAVTLGCALRGATPWPTAVMYMGVQLLGALCAGGFGRVIQGDKAGFPKVSKLFDTPRGRSAAFGAEVVYTTALVFTVLSVATAKATAKNNFFGLVRKLHLSYPLRLLPCSQLPHPTTSSLFGAPSSKVEHSHRIDAELALKKCCTVHTGH